MMLVFAFFPAFRVTKLINTSHDKLMSHQNDQTLLTFEKWKSYMLQSCLTLVCCG